MSTVVDSCKKLEQDALTTIKNIIDSVELRIETTLREDLERDPNNSSPDKLLEAIGQAVSRIDIDLRAIVNWVSDGNAVDGSALDKIIIEVKEKIPEDQCEDSWERVRMQVELLATSLTRVEREKLERRRDREPDSYREWAIARAKLLIAERVTGIL